MSKKLTDHKVLVFDVYGTLADWETGLYNALTPMLAHYPASKNWTRKDALTAFMSVEYEIEAQNPGMLYSDLLAKVLEVLEQRLKALSGQETSTTTTSTIASDSSASTSSSSTSSAPEPSANEHRILGDSIKNWSIFPDSSDALHRLARHFKLVVLSNVDHQSFKYTHLLLSTGKYTPSDLPIYTYPDPNPHKYWHPRSTPGSKSPFTLVLTAQDTGCYKPALGGFKTVLECARSDPDILGSEGLTTDEVKEKVLSVAQSLLHDHEPANAFGMRSVWIDRQGSVTLNENPGGPDAAPKWTWRFETLGEMADAVEKELEE